MRRRGAGPASSPRRLLDMDVLGVLLLGAVTLAWLTGAPYLLVRLGAGLPFRLVLVDGIHCYVGLVTGVILLAKLRRGGRGRTVAAMPGVTLWDRWVSLSMAVLYSAVMVTGVMALLPLGADTRTAWVDAHLLFAVWAAGPTTWHVLAHRARIGAAGSRVRQRLSGDAVARGAVALALAGSLILVAVAPALAPGLAPALAPLTQAHAGLAWHARGPQVLLDRLEVSPDGKTLVAGGEGLFVSSDGQRWRQVGGFGDTASRTLVLALRVTAGATYAGTIDGLYSARSSGGPYHVVRSPAREVHGIEVDPGDPSILWVAAYNGVWMSPDGGTHWSAEDAGLPTRAGAWALRFFHGTLFLSDATSVDRWDGRRWILSNSQGDVDAMDASADGTELFATSMGHGVAVFDGHGWRMADAGLAEHSHDGLAGIHVDSVTDVGGGTVFAGTMVGGIAESRDGGRTWSGVWDPVGGDVWRVRPFDGELVAATDFGLLTYGPLPPAPAASALWWLCLLAAALVGGMALVRLARPRRLDAAQPPAGIGATAATMRRS